MAALPINVITSSTITLLGPVLGLALVVIVSAYLAGHILRNEKLKEKSGQMLFDIIAFFVVFIFLTDLISEIASTIVINVNPKGYSAYCQPLLTTYPDAIKYCHIFIARGYLNSLAAESISATETILRSYAATKLAESLTTTVKKEQREERISGKSATPYNTAIETYNGYLQTAIIVSLMLLFAFDFFVKTFGFLLSIGIVLRAFPGTQRLGGLLMAIALTMFFFYPTVLSVLDIFYENIPLSRHTDFRINRIKLVGPAIFGLLKIDYIDPHSGNVIPYQLNQTPNIVQNNTQPIYASPVASTTQAISNNLTNTSNPVGAVNTMANIDPNNPPTPTPSILEKALEEIVSFFKGIAFLSSLFPQLPAHITKMTIDIIKPSAGYISGTLSSAFALTFSAATVVSGFEITTSLIYGLADIISNFIIFIGVFAYIAIISTIGVIKSLSEFLGGEIEIAGLTHIL